MLIPASCHYSCHYIQECWTHRHTHLTYIHDSRYLGHKTRRRLLERSATAWPTGSLPTHSDYTQTDRTDITTCYILHLSPLQAADAKKRKGRRTPRISFALRESSTLKSMSLMSCRDVKLLHITATTKRFDCTKLTRVSHVCHTVHIHTARFTVGAANKQKFFLCFLGFTGFKCFFYVLRYKATPENTRYSRI